MLSTALTTALPAIIDDFNISVTSGQWLTSGYSLAMGIIMPLTAFLITKFPTRRLYLSGLFFTFVGLICCVIAPNFIFLMIARVLQACGNGILTSMAQVIILSIYPPEKRGTAMGWYGLSIGAAPVIAPTLAGYFVDIWGWRAIFYLVIAIVFVSLICAFFVFDNILDTISNHFDILSFIVSIFAFGGITLGVGNLGSYPIMSIQVFLCLAVGILSSVIFVFKQLKTDSPFLNLKILKYRYYAISVVGSVLLYFVMMGSSIMMPIYVQRILGQSATISGLVVLPGSLAMALISPFAGRIYDKLGMKPLFIGAAAVLTISGICMTFITAETSIWVAAGFNMLRSTAIGCLMMPTITWGTASLPDKKLTAHGTALLASLRTIAGAIGTAVFVGIMNYAASHSNGRTGTVASVYGLNVAFLFMGIISSILLLIGIFGIKPKNKSV